MYMDTTYNVHNYNIHLIPLLVLGDFQEGIPVASNAIFNMEDKVANTGVHIIKLKCKGFKSCLWFMQI